VPNIPYSIDEFSFGLGGVARLFPFVPAAFQGQNLLKAQVVQFPRHPDDGALLLSVEDDFLVLRQVGSPGRDGIWILAHRALDFFIADIPIFGRSDV